MTASNSISHGRIIGKERNKGVLTGVRFALLDIFSVPLTYARTAGIGQNQSSNILKSSHLTVTGDGSTNLLGTGGDGVLACDGKTVCLGFVGDGGRARHILIRRVGAGTDQGDLELSGPLVLFDSLSKLGDGGGEIGSEGTIDVGLKFR